MHQKTITVINKLGLHTRAASKLVDCASRYLSDIKLTNLQNKRTANAKRIIEVMTLGAKIGTELELTVNGEDETEAFEKVEQLILSRFGETE